MAKLLFLILSISLSMPENTSFKQKQMSFSKVKAAYREKEKDMIETLKRAGIKANELEIYIRVFKSDKIMELWAKFKGRKNYELIKEFAICTSSGIPGPKRMEGDMQVPEGFYSISHFNPESNFYLSLGINYPNASDRILADKMHPGGAIYIHGNCVTIGCIPITDEKIKELYIYAVEARNNGQSQIPVSIFPCRMDDKPFLKFKMEHAASVNLFGFWGNLKQGYDFFQIHKYLPKISVQRTGLYGFL